MGKGNNRKSIVADGEGSLNPDFDVKDTVRVRKHKMLKAMINSAMKLTAEDSDATIRVLKSELEFKWNDYMLAFEEVESIAVAVDDSHLGEITNEFIAMHNSFIKAKVYVAGLIETSTENTPSVSNSATVNDARPPFKMAPMKISPFSGNLSEWIEFRATCDIILTSKFPEVQRLQYLKDALFGEARSVVSHILPGEGAFDRAMQLLKNRYDNQRSIINEHLKRFYAMERIDTPSADSFRLILNTLNGLVAALKCYEIDTSSWDSILIFHISQRFDKHTLLQWGDKLGGKRTMPKLQTLLDFLQIRITVRQST